MGAQTLPLFSEQHEEQLLESERHLLHPLLSQPPCSFPFPSLLSGASADLSLEGDMVHGTHTSLVASKAMTFQQGAGPDYQGAVQRPMP